MSAVPTTLVGILAHEDGTAENVTFTGLASITGLTVGGGPIVPDKPPQIWGPTDPRPTPPIHLGPGGEPLPPVVGGGPILPDNKPPTEPPPTGTKPPPDNAAGWGYYDGRWGYFPGPQDASPKR